MTQYEGAALRNDVGGCEILQRCKVRSWDPNYAADETCRVCGHQHIQLCFEIYDPDTGLVVYPVGSECIYTYTENTPQDRTDALREARLAEKRRRDAQLRLAAIEAQRERDRLFAEMRERVEAEGNARAAKQREIESAKYAAFVADYGQDALDQLALKNPLAWARGFRLRCTVMCEYRLAHPVRK